MLRKITSLFLLLTAIASLSQAKVLVMTAQTTKQILPGKSGEDIRAMLEHYLRINPSSNETKIMLANNESISKNGVSYSFPIKIYMDYNEESQFINKYRVEFNQLTIDLTDPSFTTANPLIRIGDFTTIICDNNNNKKMMSWIISKTQEEKTQLMRMEEMSEAEGPFIVVAFLSRLQIEKPIAQFTALGLSKKTYNLMGNDIEISEANPVSIEFTITKSNNAVEKGIVKYFADFRIPKYVQTISPVTITTTEISAPRPLSDDVSDKDLFEINLE